MASPVTSLQNGRYQVLQKLGEGGKDVVFLCQYTVLGRHARRLVFQLAEVTVPRALFQRVLERIGGLRPVPG